MQVRPVPSLTTRARARMEGDDEAHTVRLLSAWEVEGTR